MVALALLAGLVWGAGDFLGGIASRRTGPGWVAGAAFASGLGLLVVIALVRGAGRIHGADLGWGAAAGVGGGLGILCLYAALGAGAMSRAAPVSAVVGAAVPVAADLVRGTHLSPFTLLGIALAGVAIWLVAGGEVERDEGGWSSRVLALAVGAGAGFGLFFVFVDEAAPAAGAWPLVAARSVSTVIVIAATLAFPALRAGGRIRGAALAFALGAGVFDAAANQLYALAADRGALAVAAVLASLYPAATVALSVAVLRERLGRRHAIGVAVALVAVACVTGGA